MLDQFFGTAMKKADMGIDPFNDLAIKFQHEAQYTVRSRVLRPKIDGEISLRHLRVDNATARQMRQASGARTEEIY